MNIDPYELDAQARNQNAKRDRTAKNKEVQKTQLPHTRLKADFKLFRNITSNQIDHLTKKTFTKPVTSVYINMTPERLQRQKDVFLTVFNSLKHTALLENKQYLDSLAHDQQQSIEDDLWLIHKYLQDEFDASGVKSIAIFKSGDDLQRVYLLGIPGDDYMGIDPDPYTLPLLVALEKQRSVLVLQLEVDTASFYRYHSGTMRHLDTIKSQVPDLSLDKSRPNKIQRHNFDHLNRHLKDVCTELGNISQKQALTDIVLIGENRILNLFQQDCLSQDKRNQVMAVLPPMPGATAGQIAGEIEQQLQQSEIAEEGYYLDMIRREDGRDGIVKGLDEVVSAQNRHMVRSLLVDKELKQPGFFCQQDNYISINETHCPLCTRPMVPIDNIVEKLIELASQYRVDYKIIQKRSNELDRYGGIAATMYEFNLHESGSHRKNQ